MENDFFNLDRFTNKKYKLTLPDGSVTIATGVLIVDNCNIKRVVTSKELSIDEIHKIVNDYFNEIIDENIIKIGSPKYKISRCNIEKIYTEKEINPICFSPSISLMCDLKYRPTVKSFENDKETYIVEIEVNFLTFHNDNQVLYVNSYEEITE